MADSGLLRAIASPSLAPFQQGLATGRSFQDRSIADQERARVNRARGLAGAALGQIPGIDQGLAQADPNLALSVFEAVGVAGEARQTQFREDVRVAAGLAQANPRAAVQSIEQAIRRNEAQGIQSPEMRQFLQEFQADPVTGAQNLQQLNSVLSPQKAGFTLGEGQQRFDAQGKPIAAVAPKTVGFQLDPGEQRFEGGRVVATGAAVAVPAIPPQIIDKLPKDVADKASAAFSAAGGGKDGLKAAVVQIDKGSEQSRRQASPEIIAQSFPSASPAETQQLQAAMDAAKTTESGLKAAEKIRVKQRRDKKAQVFQDKAVTLLKGILANPQLGDVLGSIEGAIDVRFFSDAEAELIADIQEAGNILTADNLDLMSGVLSESDIKILQNLSGGALNRLRTEKRFVGDVTELVNRLSAQKVTTVDDQSQEAATPIASPSGRQGGTLMTDAAGNRAFVFPDGTFEEVQ